MKTAAIIVTILAISCVACQTPTAGEKTCITYLIKSIKNDVLPAIIRARKAAIYSPYDAFKLL